jgi:hypothetical protein
LRTKAPIKRPMFFVWPVLVVTATGAAARVEEIGRCDPATAPGTVCICELDSVRPTQGAVGWAAVDARRKRLSEKTVEELDRYLRPRPAPGYFGPDGAFYIVDRHHLSRVLHTMGHRFMYCMVLGDRSDLDERSFWSILVDGGEAHAFDADGNPIEPAALPDRIADLPDDPFRSLAGFVRDACKYEKSDLPFAEFAWAEFFRRRVTIEPTPAGWRQAVDKAGKLAGSPEARGLPGYCGQRCACDD